MKYIPESGDIVWLDFDPSAGTEIIKRRPALILSRKIFNSHTGFAMVAPITSTKRDNKFTILIPKNNKINGYVLCYQARTLDFKTRNLNKIIDLDVNITNKAQDIVKLILS